MIVKVKDYLWKHKSEYFKASDGTVKPGRYLLNKLEKMQSKNPISSWALHIILDKLKINRRSK